MFKFLFANHRKNYMQIAWKYNIWPERVYKIAHGTSATTVVEKKVQQDLLNLGIIHRHHRQHEDLYS